MSRFVRVAARAEVKPGRALAVQAGRERLALFEVDGDLVALHNSCSHEYAPLSDGRIRGGEVECCLHGARFDLRTGAVRRLPAVAPVKTYPVQVSGDDVLVEVED